MIKHVRSKGCINVKKDRPFPDLQFILNVNKLDKTLNYGGNGLGFWRKLVDFLMRLDFVNLLPSIIIGSAILFINTLSFYGSFIGSYPKFTF